MEKYEWGPNIEVYYTNDQVKRYIETIYVVNFYTSYQYDKEKGYIYTTNDLFDKSKVTFYNGDTEIKDNKLRMILAGYSITYEKIKDQIIKLIIL